MANDLTEITDPAEHATTIDYDAGGEPTAITDATDHTTNSAMTRTVI